MVNRKVKTVFERIRSLKIQGARNVAREAVKSLAGIKSLNELKESVEYLKKSRPTEPMMRNGLKYVLVKTDEGHTVKEAIDEFIQMMDDGLKSIAEIGAKRILDNAKIMTFCHSSTVMSILKKAWKEKRRFEVYVAETRPLYQGRITAKELSAFGIPTTIHTDGAVRALINGMSLALMGVDAITSDGHIINKDGTSMVALSAHEARTGCAFACELLKFDPITLSGDLEPIEKRNVKEVWDKAPKKLRIVNPAFDVTPPEYINYLITEHGVINPVNAFEMVMSKYPWMFEYA